MSLFKAESCAQALREAVETRKVQGGLWTYQRLAQAMGVHKSYLSAVFKGRAQLSADQLYLAGQALQLNARERSFLELLLEFEKSGIEDRRRAIKKDIDARRSEATAIHANLPRRQLVESPSELAAYYLEPLHQVVHMALSIPLYARQPEKLRSDLELSKPRFERVLTQLVDFGLAERDDGGAYRFKGRNLHLPKDNPLFRGYQRAQRQVLIERLGESSEELSFSAYFTADDGAAKQVREKLLAAIRDVQAEVQRAPSERVFQLNLDFLPWT